MGKLPNIVVALNIDEMDVPNLCAAAKGVKTTDDPDVTNPPVTDDKLKEDADAVMVVHEQRYTNQSESLTRLENELASKIKRAYARVGHYVQDIANEVAVTKGDYDAGVAVVLRCGFTLKSKAEVHPRSFEIVNTGKGMIQLRVKSVGSRAGYAWRYGITTEEGTPPTQFLPLLFCLSCEIIINNLTKGAIYGYQVASILPASHTSKTSAALTATTEKATVSSATKAKKPTFTAGVDPLNWSDFIYEGTR